MQQEIWKFIGILIIGAVFGLLIDQVLLCILLVSLGIIAWQVYRLDLLYQWLVSPNKNDMPDTSGQFYLLHKEIARRNNKSRNRKRQLASTLNQFRKAAMALPDGVILIDDFGKIEWANSNAKLLLGIRWPEDAQVRFNGLVREPVVNDMLNDEKVGREGTVIESRYANQALISIRVIRFTPLLRMIIARDISQLMRINQIQADFVANVSHELKTPLTVIKGYLEILENQTELPESLQKPIMHMSRQSERMQSIVHDLLYLAQLEDKQNKQPHDSVNITQLINGIMESIETEASKKQHKVTLDIDYQLQITGQATELHTAFSNLILNAIRYTEPQGVIKILWKHIDNKAHFVVSDNGIGITNTEIPNLTRRFYRVDGDRSRDSGGTGLGLAIVKHVLQRHNGQLEVDSQVDVGSEFRCVFPSQRVLRTEIKQSNQSS